MAEMNGWRFCALALLAISIEICSPIANAVLEIIAPAPGSVLELRDAEACYVHVEIADESYHHRKSKQLVIESDGVLLATSTDMVYKNRAAAMWSVGFHNLTSHLLDGNGQILVSETAHFLVVDTFSEFFPALACPSMITESSAVDGDDATLSGEPGFGSLKWNIHRKCLETFLDHFPSSAGAQYQYGRLWEAEGSWEEAMRWYRKAATTGLADHLSEVIERRIETMTAYAEAQIDRLRCWWNRVETCSAREGRLSSCEIKDNQTSHGFSHVNADLDGEIYLSIIMVTRHDSTQFCQVPKDACLDRLRASLSILLERISAVGMAGEVEIILVEWNPCYLNSKQEEGACDPREDDGYMSLEEAVRSLVEIPSDPVIVRILLVTEEMHDNLYNPYGFDLMEFIGKNAAARRAKGRFLLFTNPDDCITEGMAAMLARKQLREDTVYATFRGGIEGHVPVGRNASAASMSRFVEHNGFSSEHQPLSVAHKAGRWRRAACLQGEVDEEPMRGRRYGFFHDSAAGDFLLLPRRMLERFRGYPEIPTNIMIDGTAIHAAAAHGFGELVLGGACVVLHQTHPRSYNTRGSMISLDAYESLAQQLLDAGPLANIRPDPPGQEDQDDPAKRPWHRWNGPDWGLAHVALPEVVLSTRCD